MSSWLEKHQRPDFHLRYPQPLSLALTFHFPYSSYPSQSQQYFTVVSAGMSINLINSGPHISTLGPPWHLLTPGIVPISASGFHGTCCFLSSTCTHQNKKVALCSLLHIQRCTYNVFRALGADHSMCTLHINSISGGGLSLYRFREKQAYLNACKVYTETQKVFCQNQGGGVETMTLCIINQEAYH